ncbi:hypothetical protein VOLCADRAFT_87679 [Volvox carteri f. nagariensis]|uniref:DDE-1 domain-containing protein n=1 Tax=Volvox carteri f. nagariensis TaxID=3068 RepID=D8TLY8_VOLCA|nr:uncharacterized protein VOLCADRAFT_87679 [Volvox carteri f. nagariensis]EFJ51415.1 hypothetical protein VOLCADRAFT_87679 [Volvox carteri f. nagariensis]|eukprot:XP_002947367.1 hypothetical protein VOLCADRAFT_87679 [Volvox carteri f. nagariensis]
MFDFAPKLPKDAPVDERLGVQPTRIDPEIVAAQTARDEAAKAAMQAQIDSAAEADAIAAIEKQLEPDAAQLGRPAGSAAQAATPLLESLRLANVSGPRGNYHIFSHNDKQTVVNKVKYLTGHDVKKPKIQSAINTLYNEAPHLFSEKDRPLAWQTVKNWWFQWLEDKTVFTRAKQLGGRAFKSTIPAEVMVLTKTAIQDMVASGCQANSSTMRPYIVATLKAEGYGSILEEYGGTFRCSASWIRKVCKKLRLSHRAATCTAQKLPPNAQELLKLFVDQVAWLVGEKKIPPALVINADQTGANLFPVSYRTYAAIGAKQVRQLGLDDKRQIMAMIAVSAAGDMLPLKVIFQGKTERALPSGPSMEAAQQEQFLVTYSDNHWANKTTMRAWVARVLQPYMERIKRELQLPADHPWLLIIDCWGVHLTEEFQAFVKAQCPGAYIKYVPANCTSIALPCDVGINKPFKDALHRSATMKVIDTVRKLKDKGVAPKDISSSLRMSRLKPLTLLFLVKAYKHIKSRPSAVKGAFERCGLLAAFTAERQLEAMRLERDGKLFPPAPSKKQAVAEASTERLMPGLGNALAAPSTSDEDAGQPALDEAPLSNLPYDDVDDDVALQQLLTHVQRLQDESEQGDLAAAATGASDDDEGCADLLFEPSPAKKPRTEAGAKKQRAKKQPAKQRTTKEGAGAKRVVATVCTLDGAESESEVELSDIPSDDSDTEEGSGDEEEVVEL